VRQRDAGGQRRSEHVLVGRDLDDASDRLDL
jgi:hypothetical protein